MTLQNCCQGPRANISLQQKKLCSSVLLCAAVEQHGVIKQEDHLFSQPLELLAANNKLEMTSPLMRQQFLTAAS